MNIDIDTSATPPDITIADDKQLCDVIYDLAQKQLIINAAEAKQQAAIEAAKKAFADATAPLTDDIKTLFAAVETYATSNKDRLFPVKGKKRSKTFKVLAHKLQYRSSTSAEAPANAVSVVHQMLQIVQQYDAPDGNWNGIPLDQVVCALEGLLRQPPQEINKDEIIRLCTSEDAASKALAGYLHLHGIRAKETETFKLAFAFTPEQQDA